MLKKILVSIFVVLIFMGGAGILVLNNSSVTAKLLTDLSKQYIKNISIEKMTIASQKIQLPNDIEFHDVQFSLVTGGESYLFSVPKLHLKLLSSFFDPEKVISIECSSIKVEQKKIKLNDGTIKARLIIQSDKKVKYDGAIQILNAETYAYKMTRVKADFSGDSVHAQINNIHALAYDGSIKGQVSIEFKPALSYSVNFGLHNIQTEKLREVNSSVFDQVVGSVTGKGHFVIHDGKVQAIEADAHMSKGGLVNGLLLSSLLEYVPFVLQDELKQKLKQGRKVKVEIATVEIKSFDQKKITGVAKLNSKELNANFNLPFDINLDERLDMVLNEITEFILNGFQFKEEGR